MKILVDNNLSYRLIPKLNNIVSQSSHVQKHGLEKSDDKTVWHFAKENNFAILTKDADFDNIVAIEGCPPKIIKLNCGNKKTGWIIEMIEKHQSDIKNFLTQTEDCILIIS